jgi:LemA protein
MMFIWVVVAGMAAVGLWAAATYNRFVRFGHLIREAASDVDVQLKRRHDLIPKLVEAVEGYARYERAALESLVRLRGASQAASGFADKGRAEAALTRELRHVFALAEAYPDLKANQSFLELQKSVSDVEEHIQLARRYYNGTVRDFNVLAASFPSVMVGRAMGAQPAAYFDIDPLEREVPPTPLGEAK